MEAQKTETKKTTKKHQWKCMGLFHLYSLISQFNALQCLCSSPFVSTSVTQYSVFFCGCLHDLNPVCCVRLENDEYRYIETFPAVPRQAEFF